jgi:hypothetical protein
LIERARERRAVPRTDSGLANYQATASGYVYFFLDRAGSDERTLVKVDQLALEVYWAAPNLTKQRIVGLRDASKLPNRMRYHLDHLTVVQDEFGDLIRMGDGDEVRAVPHPAAHGSEEVYDFRLADSISIRLPSSPQPILVYELEVRPRQTDRPAFVGSIFLDRASAAIVRMNFTFTPASYVDRRLDYIRVSLDNGLWDGKYWLPHEQSLEIRRQVPELDIPAGGVIRGTLQIGGYLFNQELPPGFFRGPRVIALPREEREQHPFDAGLFEGLAAEGISANADLAALRRQAVALIGKRYLSGLPRLRLYAPNASSVLRYNRAESLFLGGGLSYAPAPTARLRLATGYATGPGHLSLAGGWQGQLGKETALWVQGERYALRDLGVRPGAVGALNTIAAMSAGSDFLDPYYASGVGAGAERRLGGAWKAALELGYERHRSAELTTRHALLDREASFRPVRAVAEGSLLRTRLALLRDAPMGEGWSGALRLDGGSFEGATYLRPTLEGSWSRRSADHRTEVELNGAAGILAGDAPPQMLFLLGGAGTLPGYRYRSFGGERFLLAGAEVSREVLAPWVRLRLLGAAGWAGRGERTPGSWDVQTTDGIRTSVGAGVGLFYDLLRLDLARGLQQGGSWQWIVSVNPGLSGIL